MPRHFGSFVPGRRLRVAIGACCLGWTLTANAYTPQVDWDPTDDLRMPEFTELERPETLREDAYRALRADDWRLALVIARAWVRIDPDNDFPWVLMAWAHAENNDYAGVVEAYNRAIDINPQQRHPVWRSLGVAYTMLKRFDHAESAFARAAEVDAAEPRAWFDLCEAHLRNGQAAKALQAVQQAIQREPEYAEAWSCRGQALIREKRLEEALTAFRRAIGGKTLEPRTDRASFWTSLGWVYHQLKREDGVQEAFEGISRWDVSAAERFREQMMAGRESDKR